MKALTLTLLLAAAASSMCQAQRLVLLHTNDTHSQIDPTDSNEGGALRRKVLIDSVRAVEPNVRLIDAGDAVQGTLFFNLYKGEAEHKVMNLLGYDLAILGNHDFDNGINRLAENIATDSATWITTNYDLRDTPLDPYFVPYVVEEIDGKKVGFIGINLDPKGMISDGNYDGLVYLDPYEAANATAWSLKHNERCDAVVAITHLGYDVVGQPDDLGLAASSKDIDLIIGGHSHTLINPADGKVAYRVPNALGDTITVTQVGKSGKFLGQSTIDLASGDVDYKIIHVDSRLDSLIKPEWVEVIAPYRYGVDSLMNVKVSSTPIALESDGQRLPNFLADFVVDKAQKLTSKPIDLGLINRGGIRRSLPKGNISEGQIMTMLPFDNSVTVIEVKGSDLAEALAILAESNAAAISKNGSIQTGKTKDQTQEYIGGEPIDPDKTYTVATIDYLANGGDYAAPLKKATVTAKSDQILWADLLDYLRHDLRGKPLKTDATQRIK
ncbi:MAG: bifunctional metallophosphatase/5'-nucleotidase [Bacteroidales bacterium]|nr:bifunctional metallophosphatase/5'-nucleotidase [Bacteroidales bacterium]